MNDTILRHMIAAFATAVALLAYFSGYWSAKNGWWWTAFGLAVIYIAMYKFVNSKTQH